VLSLKTKAYYLLKPAVPKAVALGLRRWLGRRKQISYAATWPIDERSGATPASWPGWPEGKRFALVLTHDIEGPKGLDRVPQLIDLEVRNNVRASYNFVPGEGPIPPELRQMVEDAGGEVGVHGLEHDGKLFFSKTVFERKAARIQQYLREWNAVGFRSPFMHHKLSWMHKLGATYDSSTFDTDPFEPQPDGVRTIFPFWVPAADETSGGGYVELPYTLVQDFTLFEILGEKTIDIWKKKLDWIAERGGMALINTHPDYMRFGDHGAASGSEYPAKWYEDLLSYAKDKYGDAYWQALPREIASYYVNAFPNPADRNTRKRICMITDQHYAPQNHIQQYAEVLARRGDLVDVIAAGAKTAAECIGGVSVNTIKQGSGFLPKVTRKLLSLHRDAVYDCIHISERDGSLALAACLAKVSEAKVILDWQKGSEPFRNNFRARTAVSLLKAHEIASQDDDKSTATYSELVDKLAMESFEDLPAAP
jgi:peptidoglycan/xylan/chitin deacetylase (PgdA/CDA1 family)